MLSRCSTTIRVIGRHSKALLLSTAKASASTSLQSASAIASGLTRIHNRSQQQRFLSTSASASATAQSVTVNGTRYSIPLPGHHYVALLIDGCSQDYLAAASAAGCTPYLDALLKRGPGLGQGTPSKGVHALVSGQIPSLTNPNNVAIVCGASAAVTGICGNYFLDETCTPPKEQLMNSTQFLRAPTIFSQLQQQGKMNITILTAKDKLLSLLSSGLDRSSPHTTAFSIEKLAERAQTGPGSLDQATLKSMTEPFYRYFETQPELLKELSEEQRECIKKREIPNIYNPHISLYLLQLGLGLFKRSLTTNKSGPASFFYLSTTDYVQHKYLPNDPEALRFYKYIDSILSEFDSAGAILAFTADHGMNSKVGWNGEPKVVFLQSELEKVGFKSRVILPITDPYVKHHSSLGGYGTIYLEDKSRIMEAMRHLRTLPGIYTVLNREEACRAFELPADRVGDIVVLGDVSTVLGKTPADHDLAQVPHLRSHGSLDEATVPMVLNRRLTHDHEQRMTTGKTRNYHLLDMMLNGIKDA